MSHDSVVAGFKKAIYKGLAIEAIEADNALNLFSGNDFNGKIAQFRKIDSELTELSKSVTRRLYYTNLPTSKRCCSESHDGLEH